MRLTHRSGQKGTRVSITGQTFLFLALMKCREYCVAIKCFTDTYKIKGSDIDRFCRIMSDTKKIKIQITNDHHDLKDVKEFKKMFGFIK